MNVSKINAINPSNLRTNQAVTFKAKSNEAPAEREKRSLTAKKWGVGIASLVAPGTGQMINGEGGKGATILIPAIILNAITARAKNKLLPGVALLALALYSIINGVSNVKPDKE